MQFLRTQFRALCSKTNLLASSSSDFHTQTCRMFKFQVTAPNGVFKCNDKVEYWDKQNEKEYEIQKPGEEPRKAEMNYTKKGIPVSWKNLWYVAKLVEGMTVDEALKQLSFIPKKGAYYIKDAIKEAQMLAVTEHNVEFKSNLWISSSYPWKDKYVFRGLQRKAKQGPRKLRSARTFYFLTLKEGKPPADFQKDPTGEEMFEEFMRKQRARKIMVSL